MLGWGPPDSPCVQESSLVGGFNVSLEAALTWSDPWGQGWPEAGCPRLVSPPPTSPSPPAWRGT